MRRLLMASALLAGVGSPAVSGGASATTLLVSQNTAASAGEETTQGSDQVKTLSPRAKVAMTQPLVIVSTKAVTDHPYVSLEGYRQTVGALQRTLTERQQLTL